MGIELLLGGVIKLLGSAGFGTLFGGIMGIFNRKADLAQKRVELEHEKSRWDHDLQLREADARIMQMEVQGKLQIAQTEAEAKVEVAGYEAMAKSYDYARPVAGSKMEAFSSFVRPAVTLAFFLASTTLTACLYWKAFEFGWNLPAEKVTELVFLVTDWTLAMAGTTIGWWFATRPGKALRGSK
jgi:hypothetical protein